MFLFNSICKVRLQPGNARMIIKSILVMLNLHILTMVRSCGTCLRQRRTSYLLPFLRKICASWICVSFESRRTNAQSWHFDMYFTAVNCWYRTVFRLNLNTCIVIPFYLLTSIKMVKIVISLNRPSEIQNRIISLNKLKR